MVRSKAKAEADARFEKKTYDKILLRLRKDSEINGDYLRKYAASIGESVNGFILRAITETINRDSKRTE
ncbi:MAG: hypothetical protein IJ728_01515 [Selenomonadaceae bacterium]|nr:hypothetical protein [Selenomonadaceae bacterium]